jgi:ERCC4-related helicase
MSFAVGSLVKARGREWIVLPESQEDFLMLRPLGGTEDEIAGIHTGLEKIKPAQFSLPDPKDHGDYFSCRLLRDAVRLGFRSSAGPFRSFAKIAVEPRPYQLVPLLMALKLDPVRVLIADDVGIGKTIEAGLIAKELMERGEVQRMAVLCPPPLAEQWQTELYNKFHIEAELVLPSTVSRLERNCKVGESLFDLYPIVIVSMDFIKSDRRREEFFRTCPEMVIVDEAHTCAYAGEGRGTRHQRHRLISGVASQANRHMILVTATPHSGKEEAFRSLLGLLKPEFSSLPEDLGGKENEHHRRRLAEHFVQRKRGDIRNYLGSETLFPVREEFEDNYRLSPEYKALFGRAINYARETVKEAGSGHFQQRIRWWSALALLRAMASSPAAAAATLRNRAIVSDAETIEEVEELGRKTVFDLIIDEASEALDVAPGCDTAKEDQNADRQRLLRMARDAEALQNGKDTKLKKAAEIVSGFINDGFQPIVFCRFIQTAEYVAQALRNTLPKTVEVMAVTGLLPPKEREERVLELSKAPKRVLVCTDCLSEGVNLQEHFNAVLHYDLSWNPTRHEQREGRVDRFGQPNPKVKVVTYYGLDNQIDGIVLDVLVRKHKVIRSALGISVPVPADTDQVIEAIFEGLLLKSKPADQSQLIIPGFDNFIKPQKETLYKAWDATVEREKRSRTMFAQHSIKVEEVHEELKAVQSAIGSGVDVERFCKEAISAHGGFIETNGAISVNLGDKVVSKSLIEALGNLQKFKARFSMPVQEGELYLNRTHPIVEGLSTFVMEGAFDPLLKSLAKRCGVIKTGLVDRRTTLLLTRFRFHIITEKENEEKALLAEDCCVFGFKGSPANAEWIDPQSAEKLLTASPVKENVSFDQALHFLNRATEEFDAIKPHLEQGAKTRADELLKAHTRVRKASSHKGIKQRVEPHLPPDVLGLYIYLPKIS